MVTEKKYNKKTRKQKKKKKEEAEPKPGPSGGVPEVSIVTIGDDSSMCVIAPEGPPVGQAVEVEDSDTEDS